MITSGCDTHSNHSRRYFDVFANGAAILFGTTNSLDVCGSNGAPHSLQFLIQRSRIFVLSPNTVPSGKGRHLR
jgi:hypothetical protein